MAHPNITIGNVVVSAGIGMNYITWSINDPHRKGLPYLQFDRTEVWASESADMADAVKIGEGDRVFVHTPVADGEVWFYRLRAINRSEQVGVFSDIAASPGLPVGYAAQGLPPP